MDQSPPAAAAVPLEVLTYSSAIHGLNPLDLTAGSDTSSHKTASQNVLQPVIPFFSFQISMLVSVLSFAWIVLPVAAWLLNLCTGKRVHGLLLLLITAIAGYALLMGTVQIVNARLDTEIRSYDLDGDGGYSDDELTPEAEKALDEWASDTGRVFAPFVGIPLTGIWYTIVLGVLYLGEWITRKLFFGSTTTKEHELEYFDENQDCDPRPEDGNPYRPPESQ